MGVGVWLILIPVILRNGLMFDKWVLHTSGPLVLYVGNMPGSTGGWHYPPGYEEARRRVRASSKGEMAWLDELRRELSEHPGALRTALLRKTQVLFNSIDIPDNGCYYFARRYCSTLATLTVGPVVLYVVGTLGLFLTFGQRRRLMPLYVFGATFGLSLIACHVVGRLKLPFIAILAVLAGGGVQILVESVRSRTYRTLVIAALAAPALVVAFWPRPPFGTVETWRDLCFRPHEFVNHAAALAREERLPEAAAMLEDGLTLFPHDPRFAERLAAIYVEMGQPAIALDRAEAALRTGTVSERLLERRARAYVELERYAEAAAAARDVLHFYPENAYARHVLERLETVPVAP
jgi:hypothetical protein